jgi:hypothetical protein
MLLLVISKPLYAGISFRAWYFAVGPGKNWNAGPPKALHKTAGKRYRKQVERIRKYSYWGSLSMNNIQEQEMPFSHLRHLA